MLLLSLNVSVPVVLVSEGDVPRRPWHKDQQTSRGQMVFEGCGAGTKGSSVQCRDDVPLWHRVSKQQRPQVNNVLAGFSCHVGVFL